MIMFSVAAAILIAAALLFIVPPLWRRRDQHGVQRDRSNLEIYKDQLQELEADLRNGILSQEQFAQGQLELERRLLEDVTPEAAQTPVKDDRGEGRGAAITVILLVPLLAVFLYLLKGTPAALSPEKITAAAVQEGNGPAHAVTMEQIEGMVQGLASRLESNPQDAEGWRMLGRSYVALGRYQEAIAALERAVAMIPNDPDLLADYADALAMTNGQRLAGKPMDMIKRALQLDPDHQKSLWLAGTAAYDQSDYPGAVAYWERLLKQLAPGSQEAQQVTNIVAEARDLAAGKRPAPVAQTTEPAASAQVAGRVSLSPALQAKVAPGDTVYVFAKAPQGPPMPLATFRAQAKDLPIKFNLDDSMAPTPMARLSDFPSVIVGARISKSGNPMPQSGDLQGMTDVVQVGSSGVEVKINSVVP